MTSIVPEYDISSSEPPERKKSGSRQVFSQPIPYKTEILARLKTSELWSACLFWPVLANCRQTAETLLDPCALKLDKASVINSLLDPVADQMESWGEGLLALLIAIHKYEADAPESESQSGFQQFMERFESPEKLLETLSDYPVIIERANLYCEQFENNLAELIHRLTEDYSCIAEAFNGSKSDALVTIEMGGGDSHQGGKTVTVLTFKSGFHVVYKPRPVAIYQEFRQLIQWLEGRRPLPQNEISLKVPKSVVREGYGWIEFIDRQPCQTEHQVANFYVRQGMHLAWLTLLGANDFHNENIIAHGEYPVLVDLETLLTPKMPPFAEVSVSAQKIYEGSVLFNGMLPFYVPLHRGGIVERGGLTGLGGEPTGTSLAWKDKGSMSMALQEVETYSLEAKNLPYYSGRVQPASQFVESLLQGFRVTYEALLQNRDAILNEPVAFEGLKHSIIRVVMHNTERYESILAGANHPQILAGEGLREQYLTQLAQAEYPLGLKQVCLSAEVEDLRNGDVPLFYTRVNSRDLYHNGQTILSGALSGSAWEKFEHRLLALSTVDLDQQLWLIESTFQLHHARDIKATPLSCETPSPKPAEIAGGDRDSSEACSAMQLEVESAISTLLTEADTLKHAPSKDELLWYGVRTFDAFSEVAPLDFDLYTGQAGIVTCLAYLGWARKDFILTEQARKGASHLLANLDIYKNSGNIGIGAFTGLSGIVYCFVHLSVLWREPAWVDACDELIDNLMVGAKSDRPDFDMVDGAAGCILALLPLYQLTKNPRVEAVLTELAGKLAMNAVPQNQGVAWPTPSAERPLLGLSHGTAGVAMALARLSAVLGTDEYLSTIKQALAYETHCFSAEHCNWPDFRFLREDGTPHFLSAWAHGAAGIGWSRLDVRHSLPELSSLLEPDIAVAVDTTLHYGLGQGHSLSQGDLGNLAFLADAAHRQGDDALAKQVQAHLQRVVGEVAHDGPQTAVPYCLKTPGLMQGHYGMAYQLQSLSGSRALPRLLLLEGPV